MIIIWVVCFFHRTLDETSVLKHEESVGKELYRITYNLRGGFLKGIKTTVYISVLFYTDAGSCKFTGRDCRRQSLNTYACFVRVTSVELESWGLVLRRLFS